MIGPVHGQNEVELRKILNNQLTAKVFKFNFVVAGIAKVPISEVVKELAPYLAALLVVLALVTYVPAVSLALPTWFGLGVVR